jgi:hypothetical protein
MNTVTQAAAVVTDASSLTAEAISASWQDGWRTAAAAVLAAGVTPDVFRAAADSSTCPEAIRRMADAMDAVLGASRPALRLIPGGAR